MRGFAPWLVHSRPDLLQRSWDLIFATSFTSLHELRGLAPQLAPIPTVLYFHENQYAYPSRGPQRFSHGFTQLLSASVADHVWFNSEWNRSSFLASARAHLRQLPDHRPTALPDIVEAKSEVMGLPLELGDQPVPGRTPAPLRLLWNHRW